MSQALKGEWNSKKGEGGMSSSKVNRPGPAKRNVPTSSASTAAKRDSLAAELERGSSFYSLFPLFQLSPPQKTDPHLSTAKRQQRTQALNTTLSQAALERRLAAAETTRIQLETRLRERDTLIERLEADRRWLAEREQEEREEKERTSREREEEKVRRAASHY
jgi:mitotic spindle assembly checkpoint protein MAD1